MRDTSGVTQGSGHRVCVCRPQLCQAGTHTDYLETCYWDEQSGERQTQTCTDTCWSLGTAWVGAGGQCHKTALKMGHQLCSLLIFISLWGHHPTPGSGDLL